MDKLYIETQQETLREIEDCIESELACTVVFGQIGSGKSWIAKELYDTLLTEGKFLFNQSLFNSLGESGFIDLIKVKIIEENEFIMIFDFDCDELYRVIVDILNHYYQVALDCSNKKIKLVFFSTNEFRLTLSRFNNLNLVNIKNITGEEAELFFDKFVGFGISDYKLKHFKFLFRKTDHSPGAILRLSQRKQNKKNILKVLISSYFYGVCAFLIMLALIMYALFDFDLFIEYKLNGIKVTNEVIATKVNEEVVEKNKEVQLINKDLIYNFNDSLSKGESSLDIFRGEYSVVKHSFDEDDVSLIVDDKVSGDMINQSISNSDSVTKERKHNLDENNSVLSKLEIEKEKLDLHTLTIRSNLYNDDVYIDGVLKGSTPITMKLPRNDYQVLIKKPGYKHYVKNVNLNESNFIYAVLKPMFNVNMYSEMVNRDTFGPAMVYVSGLERSISDNVSISARLITHEDIEKVPYEVMHSMLERNYSSQELALNSYQNRREKVFNGNMPVTCFSPKDIVHYMSWLSEGTGFIYRLPTVNELNFFYLYEHGVSDFSKMEFNNVGGALSLDDIKRNVFGIYDELNDFWQYATDSEENDRIVVWNNGVKYFSPDIYESCENEAAISSIGFRVVRENASSEY